PRALDDVFRGPLEESPNLEEPGDDQHAKEKHHDVEIDRGVCVAQRKSAERHHSHRAEKSRRGPIETKSRYLLSRNQQVRDDEDEETGSCQAAAVTARAPRLRSVGAPTR